MCCAVCCPCRHGGSESHGDRHVDGRSRLYHRGGLGLVGRLPVQIHPLERRYEEHDFTMDKLSFVENHLRRSLGFTYIILYEGWTGKPVVHFLAHLSVNTVQSKEVGLSFAAWSLMGVLTVL